MPTSNQETLGNGCVCEHGCESCDRLADEVKRLRRLANPLGDTATAAVYAIEQADKARRLTAMWEAWEAMKAALEHVTGGHESDCYLPEARAALALADRVSK